jgi:hypothetical protein
MQDSTQGGAASPDDATPKGRGIPIRLSHRALPLNQVLRPFTRTGGFYARSWATYLDRQPDELPMARPTLALAAQALGDEIVLMGFHMLRSAPDAARIERIEREMIAALEFYGEKGWLQEPENFFRGTATADRRFDQRRQQHGAQLRAHLLQQRIRAFCR